MPTAFGKSFKYAELSNGAYNTSGIWVDGTISSRTVEGTIHSMTAKETLSYSQGSRNTGLVKVISDEALSSRTQGGNEGGYVVYGNNIYQLENEMPFLNEVFSHYEYVGCLVPKSEIPASVSVVL
jgi:hypothetical protein